MRVLVTSPWLAATLSEHLAEYDDPAVIVIVADPRRGFSAADLARLQDHVVTGMLCVDLNKKLLAVLRDQLASLQVDIDGPVSITRGYAEVRAWLLPSGARAARVSSPSEVFLTAVEREPLLVLADFALATADKLEESTRQWVEAAAEAMGIYAANQGKVGNSFEFFRTIRADLDFATSGTVLWRYTIRAGSEMLRRETRRHLLLDVRKWLPRRPQVPRVYFDIVNVNGTAFTVVLFCGPHPPDASTQTTTVTIPAG